MSRTHRAPRHQALDHDTIMACLVALVAVAQISCEAAPEPEPGSPSAVMHVQESTFVPGRVELDGSRSDVLNGTGRLIAHTYTVRERSTGQIAYGPVTLTSTSARARFIAAVRSSAC